MFFFFKHFLTPYPQADFQHFFHQFAFHFSSIKLELNLVELNVFGLNLLKFKLN